MQWHILSGTCISSNHCKHAQAVRWHCAGRALPAGQQKQGSLSHGVVSDKLPEKTITERPTLSYPRLPPEDPEDPLDPPLEPPPPPPPPSPPPEDPAQCIANLARTLPSLQSLCASRHASCIRVRIGQTHNYKVMGSWSVFITFCSALCPLPTHTPRCYKILLLAAACNCYQEPAAPAPSYILKR